MGFVYIHTLLGRGARGEPEPPAAHGHQGRVGLGVTPAFFIMIIIISIIIFFATCTFLTKFIVAIYL